MVITIIIIIIVINDERVPLVMAGLQLAFPNAKKLRKILL